MEIDISGTGVALITPFTNNLEVDYNALEKSVNHIIEGGVEYLVVLGTTGETVTLTADEKLKVFNHVVEVNNNRLPIVLGHGGNNTQTLLDNLSRYDLSKVQSILSVSPPYNRPNQRGLYQHYKAFAESTKLPVILYNVPGRTGSNLEAATVLSLAKDVNNIVAVKEASGNLMQMQQIIHGAPKGFKIISGDDALTLPLISLGGVGIISVVANAFPKIMSDAVRFALQNDCVNAQKLHYQLFDLMNLTFEDGNPAGVKGMLSELNLIQNYLRLPLVPVQDSVQQKIKEAIQRINA